MKELIIELCNEVLDNNGRNGTSIDCLGIECSVCPFGNEFVDCQELTPSQNIELAYRYINGINETTSKDNINNPSHYNTGTIEVIEVIEDWKLNFNLGNAIKYIGRCEHKNNKQEDIKKAIWYLERELNNDK